MKKLISIALAAVLAMSLAACGNSDSLSGKVATDGSTSMEKVIGALKETFVGENKGVEVTYNPTDSSAGITAVLEGRCDIGLSSRNLKDSEIEQGLIGTVLAYTTALRSRSQSAGGHHRAGRDDPALHHQNVCHRSGSSAQGV